jgi:hypothetical protein
MLLKKEIIFYVKSILEILNVLTSHSTCISTILTLPTYRSASMVISTNECIIPYTYTSGLIQSQIWGNTEEFNLVIFQFYCHYQKKFRMVSLSVFLCALLYLQFKKKSISNTLDIVPTACNSEAIFFTKIQFLYHLQSTIDRCRYFCPKVMYVESHSSNKAPISGKFSLNYGNTVHMQLYSFLFQLFWHSHHDPHFMYLLT